MGRRVVFSQELKDCHHLLVHARGFKSGFGLGQTVELGLVVEIQGKCTAVTLKVTGMIDNMGIFPQSHAADQ
ncbi:MAG: hypothetical protein KOO60_00305 [Gemmatimonadales bacterium]|nr:hypothetical protein [Gemmatimonadales bacterium]